MDAILAMPTEPRLATKHNAQKAQALAFAGLGQSFAQTMVKLKPPLFCRVNHPSDVLPPLLELWFCKAFGLGFPSQRGAFRSGY